MLPGLHFVDPLKEQDAKYTADGIAEYIDDIALAARYKVMLQQFDRDTEHGAHKKGCADGIVLHTRKGKLFFQAHCHQVSEHGKHEGVCK